MKKTIVLCLASAIAGALAGWFANQKANTEPYSGCTYEHLAKERLHMIAAQDELLHVVYKNDPTYWDDVLMETDEYFTVDSVRGGDWEDFYLY